MKYTFQKFMAIFHPIPTRMSLSKWSTAINSQVFFHFSFNHSLSFVNIKIRRMIHLFKSVISKLGYITPATEIKTGIPGFELWSTNEKEL